jgi:hypothetical protein
MLGITKIIGGDNMKLGKIEIKNGCKVCHPERLHSPVDSKDEYGCIKIYHEGWKCVSCGTIWAPRIEYCKKCETKKESKENIKDIKE